MDHHRKGTHTPKRFVSMRGQRSTSSAASSAETSPHFLSYRQATTPSRPSVALPGQPRQHPATASVSSGGGARLREPWPSFGDAIRQSETADTIFGVRKRTVVSRSTIINGRPTTLVTRPTSSSLARRPKSEPGSKGVVSSSSSATSLVTASASATPDNAPRKKVPHRLSPTALDWVPRTNSAAVSSPVAAALSPRLSSLSYADVARIGDGRPPPPFPILQRVINPRGRYAASTGTIVRPGANSSIATSRGSEIENDIEHGTDVEMNDRHNSDKKSIIAHQQTAAASATEMDPLVKMTPDKAPSCHGLGDGLADGLRSLGQNADEGFSIGISDGIAVSLNFANCDIAPTYQIPARRAAAQNRPMEQTPPQQTSLQFLPPGGNSGPDFQSDIQLQNLQATQYSTPTTNTPGNSAPSSHAVTPASANDNGVPFDTLAAEILEKAEACGFGASGFLPQTGDEYCKFERERAKEINDRQLYLKAQRAKERERLRSAQSARPGLSYTARQFRGGKDVQDSQVRLGSGLIPSRTPTMQAPFQPVDGSSSVLGQFTIFSDGPEVFHDGRPSHPEQSEAPWLSQDGGGRSEAGQDNTPKSWDWISPAENINLEQAPAAEIRIKDVHGPLQSLIDFIDSPETWYQC